MNYWHILNFERFWNSCRNVPGRVTQTRVAPSIGEQPWLGAPRYSSPLLKWSMMLCEFSKTQPLFFLDFYCCKFKLICLQWKASIYVPKMPIEHSGIMLPTNWSSKLRFSFQFNSTMNHTKLNKIIVDWVFNLNMTCCTQKLISITHSLLHWLICTILLVIIAVLDKLILKDITYGLRFNSYFVWFGLCFGSYSHWLMFSLIVLIQGESEGNSYKVQRPLVQIRNQKRWSGVFLVVTYFQIHYRLHCISLPCKLFPDECNGSSMASEGVGHYKPYTTSKACYPTVYGLRTFKCFIHICLKLDARQWRTILRKRRCSSINLDQ